MEVKLRLNLKITDYDGRKVEMIVKTNSRVNPLLFFTIAGKSQLSDFIVPSKLKFDIFSEEETMEKTFVINVIGKNRADINIAEEHYSKEFLLLEKRPLQAKHSGSNKLDQHNFLYNVYFSQKKAKDSGKSSENVEILLSDGSLLILPIEWNFLTVPNSTDKL